MTISSEQAAEKIAPHVEKIRGEVLREVRSKAKGRTADELLATTFKHYNPYTIRPRLTELTDMGYLFLQGDTRPNRRGNNEMVYRAHEEKQEGRSKKKMCTTLPQEAENDFRNMCARLRRKWENHDPNQGQLDV